MTKCKREKRIIWFEDTTQKPERSDNNKTSMGLSADLLPQSSSILEIQFYDNQKTKVSAILISVDMHAVEVSEYRKIAYEAGSCAWVRNYSKPSWTQCKTLMGQPAFC